MTNTKKELHKDDLMKLMWAMLLKNALAEYKEAGGTDINILNSKLQEADKKLADFEKLFQVEVCN